jgi:hypothetical protein
MRRIEATGASHEYSDNLLFSALNEFYDCPYLEYGHDIAEWFPATIDIVLIRDFNLTEWPLAFKVVSLLEQSGLKHYQAQSLFYNALDEHLGCLLEP